MAIRIIHGDMREELAKLRHDGVRVQSIVTDPPYGLEFMGKEWDAPWQVSSKSALFGDRKTKMPGWGTTRNPNCQTCGGRLRGPKKCGCAPPNWDEAPNATMRRQMAGFQDWFQECAELMFDVLAPGGHLLSFGGTRTYHRMACAIEEAGFEMRDTIAWLYGSGFPKSHNVSKGIDRAAGVEREAGPATNAVHCEYLQRGAPCEGHPDRRGTAFGLTVHAQPTKPATDAARQWDGWGTALKPAMELICVARKPLVGTVAANVLAHGTGALNIDGCRVGIDASERETIDNRSGAGFGTGQTVGGHQGRPDGVFTSHSLGRWPANVVHDGSAEVVKAFPESDGQSGSVTGREPSTDNRFIMNGLGGNHAPREPRGDSDSGSAARFFYSSKACADDRLGSKHPTVKPVDLMRWLVRLVTPPGGTVLDPFAGSGTTGMACMAEGFDCILIEREAEYIADINARIAHVHGHDTPLFANSTA